MRKEVVRLQQEQERLRELYKDECEIFEKEFREEAQLKKVLSEKFRVQEKIKHKEKYIKKLKDEKIKNEQQQKDVEYKELENQKNLKNSYDFKRIKRN